MEVVSLRDLSCTQICVLIVGLTSAYLVTRSVVQYWRFRQIPGPRAAAWTNLWLLWQMNYSGERFHSTKKRLYQQYGPVQRYGPNRIMFSDLSAISEILGTTKALPKADNHDSLKAYVNGSEVISLIALTDETKATRVKRNLHTAFSAHGILKYETHVDHTVTELVNHLKNAGPVTDMLHWFSWFGFDTMARVAFSEDQGFMEQQDDVGGAIEAARQRFAHWSFYWAIPWLDAILYKNYFARNSKRPPSGLARLALRLITSRKTKGTLGTHDDFLDLYIQSGQKDPGLFTPSTVIGLTISTIHAGSETIALTLSICLYHLLKNPHILAKLRAELTSATHGDLSNDKVLSMSTLKSMPYLEACFKESERISPLSNIMPERLVTVDKTVISGIPFPKGTIVAFNTAGIDTDPNIWGEDADVYRPDRWIDANEEQRTKMNRANLQFSTGKRMCLGLHIAWMEMKKVMSALIMNFEMELEHPDKEIKQCPGVFAAPEEVKVRLRVRETAQ